MPTESYLSSGWHASRLTLPSLPFAPTRLRFGWTAFWQQLGNPKRKQFGNPKRKQFGNPKRKQFGNPKRKRGAAPNPSLTRRVTNSQPIRKRTGHS
jgi:hypothetical protein